MKEKKINSRYMISLILFVIVFLGFAVYLVYFQSFKSEKMANSEYNPRTYAQKEDTIRGDIFDNKGNPIAYTDLDSEGKFQRHYPKGEVDANITGYFSEIYGVAGLESSYNKLLTGNIKESDNELINRIQFDEDGSDLHLTLDQRIQDIAYNQTKDIVGSAVILDPKTGKVLAMTSQPSFNPNDVEKDWDKIVNMPNGPLVNRASAASYRPGSTMKIVSSGAVLKSGIDENYNDTGSEIIKAEAQYNSGDFTIKNYGNYRYGRINLASAFVNSVNTYYANKATVMGRDFYAKNAKDFLFNVDYDFDLPNVGGKIPFNQLTHADYAMTAFGYGMTEVSPLHMALVASAVANNGIIMQPYLVEKVINRDGDVIRDRKPANLSQALDPVYAEYMKELMIDTVDNGFNEGAKVKDIVVAGKTGTVENTKGTNEAWFVGFAPANNPQYVIAVVVEDVEGTGGEYASPVAGRILKEIFNK